MPYDRRTWDLVERSNQETQQLYWRQASPFRVNNADVEWVARKLIQHRRPYAAAELLALHDAPEHAPPQLIVQALEQVLQTSPNDDPWSRDFADHLPDLLQAVEASGAIEEQRIARLEWEFLPLLARPSGRPPVLLHRELAREPGFFVELVALAFRAEGEDPRELTPDEQARARNAYELLGSWRILPGAVGEDIDAGVLADWVRRARGGTRDRGRGGIGDDQIGHVLSGSPVGPDGIWPHPAVRAVIEDVQSEDLERGIEAGLYNSRGVVTKRPGEGGAQERLLADRYERFGAVLAGGAPRTAAMLRRIANTYRAETRREDDEAELREDIGR